MTFTGTTRVLASVLLALRRLTHNTPHQALGERLLDEFQDELLNQGHDAADIFTFLEELAKAYPIDPIDHD